MASIVLNEDIASLRKIFTRWLEAAGHNVRACESVVEGYEAILSSQEVDLLVTDLMMPGGDGSDLVYLLGNLPRQLPVIIVTASQDQDRLSDLREAGSVKAILCKPITNQQLIAAVADAL